MFDAIQQRLRGAGIAPTLQRMAVGMVVLSGPVHLTAEQIYEAARAQVPGISRATVYATVQLFVRHDLLRELLVDNLAAVYDSTVRPHHHVYDVDTHEVSDLAGDVQVQGLPDLGERVEVCGVDVVVRVRRRTAPPLPAAA